MKRAAGMQTSTADVKGIAEIFLSLRFSHLLGSKYMQM